jgi:hypothetical protein
MSTTHDAPPRDWKEGRRLHLERLPAYAPELKPDAGIRNLLKRAVLKGRGRRMMGELCSELRLAIRRLQRQRHLLRACVAHRGYGWLAAQRSVKTAVICIPEIASVV